MKHLFLILIILITCSCNKHPETFLEHINGYWEIEKVYLASGEEHDYNYNEYIDYFSVTDSLTGFRKKLKPLLNGTFKTSKDSEQFVIKIENDSLNIYYNTHFSDWKETILSASETQLKIINKDRNVYLYKPYKPINLN